MLIGSEALLWIAIITLSCFSVLVSSYALKSRRQLQLLDKKFSYIVENLRDELALVNSGAVGVGQRLVSMEKRLKDNVEQQRQFQENSGLPSHTQAMSMMAKGADTDQLVDRFGLTESEAQLMALMQHRSNGGVLQN